MGLSDRLALGTKEQRRARGKGVLLGGAATQGELLYEVQGLRAAQEETNRLLGLLLAQGQMPAGRSTPRPDGPQPYPAPPGPRQPGANRHGV